MSRLNWDRAYAMEQAGEDAELLGELLVIFKDSFAVDLSLMEDGVANSNSDTVSAAAHSISGAAASLGLNTVVQIARKIEKEAKESGAGGVLENVVLLKELLEDVRSISTE